jgi:hypothetical protein
MPWSTSKTALTWSTKSKLKRKKSLFDNKPSDYPNEPQILFLIELTTGNGSFWPTKWPHRVDCQSSQPSSNKSKGGATFTRPDSKEGGESVSFGLYAS